MFATTSLGMGINIPDIKRVVCWRFPITISIADMWQRTGRGGRSAGARSSAYIFLPYWAFDTKGYSNTTEETVQPKSTAPPTRATRRTKNQLPNRTQRVNKSRLVTSHTPDLMVCSITPGDTVIEPSSTQALFASETPVIDDSDAASVASDTVVRGCKDAQGRKPWTKAERSARERVAGAWFRIVNGACHQEEFLRTLGELKLPLEDRVIVPREECCSRCNPYILPVQTEAPSVNKPLSRPRQGTLSHFAFIRIEA